MEWVNTLFLLGATLLVFVMIPGLALFYGGLVRSKNFLSIATQTLATAFFGGIVWAALGYSVAFAAGGRFFGDLRFALLRGLAATPGAGGDLTASYPFFLFQMMFALLTPALMIGAYAERMRFRGHLVFTGLWILLVYAPIAHWVWGGGALAKLGALDFAGGLVVHVSSGFSALVAALVLGRRNRASSETLQPGNMSAVLVGLTLLWLGWFGFNGGSALELNEVAVLAVFNTMLASLAGGFGWMAIEMLAGKPTFLGAATGVVAGLVAITPACGFVEPWAAVVTGAVGAVASYLAIVRLKPILGYDDALDAFGCHGVAGVWGSVATGLFATTAVNEAGANGLLYGGTQLFVAQLVSVVVVALYALVASAVILGLTKIFVGLRVSPEVEDVGLDLAEHGERAYAI